MKEPMFPILNDPVLRAIPWSMIAPHEKQAVRNHSQSLNGLASRGGLSVCEAIAVIQDREWTRVHSEWARAKLMFLLWEAKRAALKEATHDEG